MADIIRASDIFDPDLLTKTITDFDTLKTKVLEVTAGFDSMGRSLQGSLGGNNLKTSADVQQFNTDMAKSTTIIEGKAKAQIALEKVEQQRLKTQAMQEAALKREAKAQEAATKETLKAEAAIKKQASAYAQLNEKYKQAAALAKDLGAKVAGGDTSLAGAYKEAAAKALGMQQQLLAIDQSAGQSQRNVGNYTGSVLKLGKAFRGLGGLGKIFGIDPEVTEGIIEAGRGLKDLMHVEEGLKVAKEGTVIATEAEIAANEEEAIATGISTGGIGLLVAAVVGAGVAIWAYISSLTTATQAENERNRALDGTIIKNDALRKAYDELRIAERDLSIDERVNAKLLTKEQGEEIKINERLGDKISRIKNEAKAARIEANGFWGSLKQIFALQSGIGKTPFEVNEEINKKETEDTATAGLEAKTEIVKEKDKTEKKEKEGRLRLHFDNMESITDVHEQALLGLKKVYDDAQKAEDKKNTEEEEKNAKKREEVYDEELKKAAEAEKKRLKKEKEELKQMAEDDIEFTSEALQRKNKLQEQQLDNDLDMRQRNIIQQQELASEGRANTLAFEKAAAAKDELEKQQLAIKEQKQQKAIAFLKLFASYADKGNPDEALSKTLIQMAIAGAIAGSYKEGIEGIDGAGTETSDSILARLSKNESVITARGTRDNAGLPTAMNEGKVDEYFEKQFLPKYLTENGSFAANVGNSYALLSEVRGLRDEMKAVQKVIKERPATQTIIDKNADIVTSTHLNGIVKRVMRKNINNNYI